MQDTINTSAIEETAEQLLNSIADINTSDPALTESQKAERNFLRQVFRPLCYYLASYAIPLPKPSLATLIVTVVPYMTGIDQATKQTLQSIYTNPQPPIDWIAQSQRIRKPENLFPIPSPEPVLRLSYACHQALPKPIRQHLALVFYFGDKE